MKNFLRLLSTLVIASLTLLAADVSGSWKATFTTPDGQTRESTMMLKAAGETLTGTLSSPRGESKIENGTIKGDEVNFTVVRNFGGEDMKFLYKGKVDGSKMALHVTAGDREFDMTAVKQ